MDIGVIKLKVLVLTCNTGGGHNSCAHYIQTEFNDYNIECDIKDYMEIVGTKASNIAEKVYLDSTKGKGNVFKNVYKLGELYNKTGIISPVYGLNKLVKDKLYNYIIENGYTLTIGTHVFPCLTLTAIKKKHDIKFVNVATDYECIPFWNETNPDVFVIPSEKLKSRFIEKGIKSDIILPTGIPVASRFFQIKGKTNIPKDKDMVLITSGSMGFGEIVDIVKAILENIDCYVVVVCGNNKLALEELKKIDNPKLYPLGFINNINLYMKESTVVVAKPGGLTTTEVAMMRKPLVHMMPIPGVESYNVEFFSQNKMSLKATNINEIITCLRNLLEDKSLQKELISNQKAIINRNSARDLIQYLIDEYGG